MSPHGRPFLPRLRRPRRPRMSPSHCHPPHNAAVCCLLFPPTSADEGCDSGSGLCGCYNNFNGNDCTTAWAVYRIGALHDTDAPFAAATARRCHRSRVPPSRCQCFSSQCFSNPSFAWAEFVSQQCTVFDHWRKDSYNAQVAIPISGHSSGSLADWSSCLAWCAHDLACKQVVYKKDTQLCYGMSVARDDDQDGLGGSNSHFVSAHCDSSNPGTVPEPLCPPSSLHLMIHPFRATARLCHANTANELTCERHFHAGYVCTDPHGDGAGLTLAASGATEGGCAALCERQSALDTFSVSCCIWSSGGSGSGSGRCMYFGGGSPTKASDGAHRASLCSRGLGLCCCANKIARQCVTHVLTTDTDTKGQSHLHGRAHCRARLCAQVCGRVVRQRGDRRSVRRHQTDRFVVSQMVCRDGGLPPFPFRPRQPRRYRPSLLTFLWLRSTSSGVWVWGCNKRVPYHTHVSKSVLRTFMLALVPSLRRTCASSPHRTNIVWPRHERQQLQVTFGCIRSTNIALGSWKPLTLLSVRTLRRSCRQLV